MQCGQSSCEIGHSQARSYTIGWTASLSATQWISGGFAVESTIETGNQYVCHGQAHEYFAIWKNQAQTAYTVQNAVYNACTGMRPSGSHFVMCEQQFSLFLDCLYPFLAVSGAVLLQDCVFAPETLQFTPEIESPQLTLLAGSPNRDNRGGNYYCVYGRQYVRWIGDRWLDTAPHTPGGPP